MINQLNCGFLIMGFDIVTDYEDEKHTEEEEPGTTVTEPTETEFTTLATQSSSKSLLKKGCRLEIVFILLIIIATLRER